MAISSPGVGSGLDIQSIVSQLVALEQKPLTQLQTAASSTKAKLSAFGQLKSQFANLQDQAAKLAGSTLWSGLSLSSSNSAAISGTLGTAATATRFNMEVSQLAQAQGTASAVVPTGTNMSGRLTIALGTWSQVDDDNDPDTPTVSQFGPQSGQTPVNVDIAATDKLSDIVKKINDADAGVSATILKDASGERLLIRSDETGATNGFRIQTSNAGVGSSIAQLGYDPENGSSGMTLSQAAQNTLATINGVSVSSTNNVFENAVPGITLTANQVTTGPVDIRVSKDTAAMKTAITNLVSSYNALSSALSTMTAVAPEGGTSGTLQGDGTVNNLQNMLRRTVTGAVAGGSFNSLSAVGVEFQKDGTLKVNDSKLTAALQNPEALQAFFVGTDSNPGLGARVRSLAQGLLGSTGAITSRTNALQGSLDRNAKEQDKIEARISLTEERLYAKYSRLDASLTQMNSLSSYVSQQVTSWNNQKSS